MDLGETTGTDFLLVSKRQGKGMLMARCTNRQGESSGDLRRT